MRRPIYCLPIVKPSKSAVLELIKAHDADYKYFEVWLDYLEDLDDAFLIELMKLLDERLIVVLRRQKLEKPLMERQKRLHSLKTLAGSPVLVDLDVGSQREELEFAMSQTKPVRLIASYHDYQQTPHSVQLKSIIATMEPYRPQVFKLAAFCNDQGDALRLLELLLELKARDLPSIVLGMGEFGQITRVFGALWGNEMTFAPLTHAESSAPGQLTRRQLENIFKELGT
jgi:3-dehydroquinate dehydratase type I